MSEFQKGYQFFMQNNATIQGSALGNQAVKEIEKAIQLTIGSMKATVQQRQNALDATIKGFIAEDFHAGTFNVDVVAKGGKSIRAFVDKTNHPTNDIVVEGKGIAEYYQVKYYKIGEETAKAMSIPKYDKVKKLGPIDQIDAIKDYAEKRMSPSNRISNERAMSYKHTNKHVEGVIQEGKYTSSNALTEEKALEFIKDSKENSIDPAKYGLNTESFINFKVAMTKAVKTGVTTALINIAIQLGPEIFKAVELLISQGEVSVEVLKHMGWTALAAPVQGFLSGAIMGGLVEACRGGLLGSALKSVDPTFISAMTVIVIGLIDNGIKLATRKIDKYEFIDSCLKHIFITLCSVSLGALTQYLIPVPVLGLLLGSLLGAMIGAFVYEGAKKICLAFCIQSGFTFFGLVDQDYTLPEEVLKQLGVSLVALDKVKFNQVRVNKVELNKVAYMRTQYSTIEMIRMRRGVIGVNRIGYI